MIQFCYKEAFIVNKIAYDKGVFIFKIDDLLQKQKKNKYQLSNATDLDYKVINRYCKGNLTRLDLGVIEKLCNYLNCGISELIEYIPHKKKNMK